MNRHSTLECSIENGVLTIRIGVGLMANAIELRPDLAQIDKTTGFWVDPEITDADVFAAAVMQELLVESDDGTTLIHTALDKAAMNAIENGADGIKLPGE